MKPGGQRIIGGRLRGKKLQPVNGCIRPTADRTREAIFNILADRIAGAQVLDLFAGSGALGLEALSRGAAFAIFIDRQPAALDLIRQNVHQCRLQLFARVVRCDITAMPPPPVDTPLDLVFMDPPYHQGLIGPALQWIQRGNYLHPNSRIVIEHDRTESVGDLLAENRELAAFILEDERRYGKAQVSFVRFMP